MKLSAARWVRNGRLGQTLLHQHPDNLQDDRNARLVIAAQDGGAGAGDDPVVDNGLHALPRPDGIHVGAEEDGRPLSRQAADDVAYGIEFNRQTQAPQRGRQVPCDLLLLAAGAVNLNQLQEG